MTTMNTQVSRLNKVLLQMEEIGNPIIVPPKLLRSAEAVVFFRKLKSGRQNGKAQGIWMQRNLQVDFGWTQPVAVSMSQGDIFWAPSERVNNGDILLLIQDKRVVETFRLYGQVGLGPNTTSSLKSGLCIENSRGCVKHMTDVFHDHPELYAASAFAYSIVKGILIPVDIECPIIKFKASSTAKFYPENRLELPEFLRRGGPSSGSNRISLIHSALARLSLLFDSESPYEDLLNLHSSCCNWDLELGTMEQTQATESQIFEAFSVDSPNSDYLSSIETPNSGFSIDTRFRASSFDF